MSCLPISTSMSPQLRCSADTRARKQLNGAIPTSKVQSRGLTHIREEQSPHRSSHKCDLPGIAHLQSPRTNGAPRDKFRDQTRGIVSRTVIQTHRSTHLYCPLPPTADTRQWKQPDFDPTTAAPISPNPRTSRCRSPTPPLKMCSS